MKISISATSFSQEISDFIERLMTLGHKVFIHGALAQKEHIGWAVSAAMVGRDVANGIADLGIVCDETGSGSIIAANKVNGIRAALCLSPQMAAAAKAELHANVIGLRISDFSATAATEIIHSWTITQFCGDLESLNYLWSLEVMN